MQTSAVKKKKEIVDFFRQELLDFLQSKGVKKALRDIASGTMTQEALRDFFIQRLLATASFEKLLLRLSTSSPYTNLQDVVKSNLRDEIGVDAEGQVHPENAHATWRKNFYTAMGVSEKMISEALWAPGTKKYIEYLDSLIKNGGLFQMAGALLFFEGMIPQEFSFFQNGRDKVFPDAFVDMPKDEEKEKKQKNEARRYIDDHIAHDAQSHFPELLDALSEIVHDIHSATESVKKGIREAKEARKSFYLGQTVFGGTS